MEISLIIGVIVTAVFVASIILAIMYRVVVPTNEVHIVQSKKATLPYGTGQQVGNVYYAWPSWVPSIGINRIVMPLSIFAISEDNYQAYDKQKVPFAVDIKGFFRIANPTLAAEKISTEEDLKSQLRDILRGTIRKLLAGEEIVNIMEMRKEIGEQFTNEVKEQLASWGVEAVKNIELMDIRDGQGSNVISDIMNRKISLIEKDSRIEIANNNRDAEIAEITAAQEANIKKQEAEKIVGEKTAEKEKAVGIAKEKAQQDIKSEAKLTKEKEMDVIRVETVKNAEIDKEKAVIKAEETKATEIINAEGEKGKTITVAEGALEAKKKEAEGVKTIGLANADTKKAMELAIIAGQIALAEKIQNSPSYIAYLENIRAIEAGEKVGTAKADALKSAEMKVIANSGTVSGGVDNVMDLLSGKGASNIVSLIENLTASEGGKALVDKLLKKTGTQPTEAAKSAPVVIKVSDTKTAETDDTENTK